jgi:hypothetical protein
MRHFHSALRRAAAITLVAARSLLSPSAAAAQQVVVDGGAPIGDVGFNVSDDYRSAAAFTVGAGGIQFDAIRFWGIAASGSAYAPDMYWQILADAGGAPDNASVVAEGHGISTPIERLADTPFAGYSSWQFDFGTGLHSLGAGSFWLALHDGTLDFTSPDYTWSGLVWEMTSGGTPYQSESISAGLGWAQQGEQGLAFQLLDTRQVVATPEPASFVLLSTGLLVILGVRRRVIAGRLVG